MNAKVCVSATVPQARTVFQSHFAARSRPKTASQGVGAASVVFGQAPRTSRPRDPAPRHIVPSASMDSGSSYIHSFFPRRTLQGTLATSSQYRTYPRLSGRCRRLRGSHRLAAILSPCSTPAMIRRRASRRPWSGTPATALVREDALRDDRLARRAQVQASVRGIVVVVEARVEPGARSRRCGSQWVITLIQSRIPAMSAYSIGSMPRRAGARTRWSGFRSNRFAKRIEQQDVVPRIAGLPGCRPRKPDAPVDVDPVELRVGLQKSAHDSREYLPGGLEAAIP